MVWVKYQQATMFGSSCSVVVYAIPTRVALADMHMDIGNNLRIVLASLALPKCACERSLSHQLNYRSIYFQLTTVRLENRV